MFSHIPEEIFCPQVSGNVHDALRVLKVKLEGPEKNTHFFDIELSLVDPENPVTQVSKTPSDEEFPWCGEDTDADVVSATYEQDQIPRSFPIAEIVMENNESDILKDKEDEPKDANLIQDKKEDILEDANEDFKKESEVDETLQENGENKSKNDDTTKMQNEVEEQSGIKDNTEGLDGIAEIDKERGVFLQAPTLEDPDKEKREKEEKVMTDYKNLGFPKRPRSMIKSELLVKDVKRFIEDMKRQTAPEDLDVRIIPSNMSCRFELPIDLTRLRGECPLSYLKKYCRVTYTRRTVYKEKFDCYSMEQTITVSDLRKIYENLFQESALSDEVRHLQRLLGLDFSMELDVETFTVISCLMERILLKSQGRGSAQGYKKNIFEVTNFSALNGKLQSIEISPQMMNLLKYIRGT